MQTKFYFLLAALVGFSSVSGKLVAQTACYDYGSQPAEHPGFELSIEEQAAFGADATGALSGLAGMTTYRLYLNTPSAMDYVSAVRSGVDGGTVALSTTSAFFQHQYGGATTNLINPALFGFFPALEFDSWVTIGLDSQPTSGQQGTSLQAEAAWASDFENGSSFSVGGGTDGGWFIIGGSNGYAGDDNKVLLAQLTTDGELNGDLNITIQSAAGASFTHQFSFTSELCGCTDPASPSYQPTATYNDGSCVYMGCTDNTACNYDAQATDDDGSCDYCCNALTSDTEGYGVEVELHDVGGVATNMRTYRVYATMANETDALSAVAGLEVNPLSIATTTSFYQSPFSGATPNNILPAQVALFPAIGLDSYVTIGLDQTAMDGELAVQMANTPGEDWAAAFEAGGNIEINSVTGGAWFVQPGASNAIAGPDNRVLIGQFTTDGYLSGTMLIQVFPEGEQSNDFAYYASFSTPTCACTDESACNYDATALWDDGTCLYPVDVFGKDYVDCDENCLNDSDGDFVCDEDEVVGCVVPGACNYVVGATDIVPCQWPQNGYNCAGDCLVDTDGDGVCDMYEIVDCTDASACNYNADSTTNTDNSLCIYAEAEYDCDGNCLVDTDGDGVCDALELGGCTDAESCNFDPTATDDDGSCDYCCYGETTVDGYSVTIEEHASSDYGTTYRMYINTDDATDIVSAISGTATDPTYITTTHDFFQGSVSNSPFPTYLLPVYLAVFPELAYDSWVTIGVDGPITEAGYGDIQEASTTDWKENFQSGGDINMDSPMGDSWFVTSNFNNGVAGDDHRVLVGQFTTTGILGGQLYVQIFDQGNQSIDQRVSLPFGYLTTDTEAPYFVSFPADTNLPCDAELPGAEAVAADAGCDLPVQVTFEDEIDGVVVTRTYTAMDAAGNTVQATQTITIVDEVSPVAVAPADISVECAAGIDPSVTGEPTASTDNCSAELTWSYSDAELSASASLDGVTLDLNSTFGLNLTGLFGQPYVVAAEGVTVGAGPELTAADIVSNPVSHRGMFEVDIDGATITLTVVGTVTGSYQYDYAHLTISGAEGFDFGALNTVSSDIAPGSTLSAYASGDALIINYDGTAVFSEGQTATFQVENQTTCLASAGVVRTWTVFDAAGNSDTAEQIITLVDTEGPVFEDFPADMTVSCGDDTSLPTPMAVDCGDVTIEVEESIMPGACDNEYTLVRTYTATDACNNATVQSHSMMVVDNAAPEFTSVPADVTVDVAAGLPTDMPTATDDCGAVSITYEDVVAAGETASTVTRTFTATDACGNASTAVQTITVNEILGCADALACNYDASATYDDGSCDYCSCGNTSGGENGFGLELELHAENGIPGLNTYRVYVTTPSETDFVSAIAGDLVVPTFLNTTTSFHQEQFGTHTPASINPLYFGLIPSLQYDSWLTVGIESQPVDGQAAPTFIIADGDSWIADFENGGNLNIESFFGGSWFTLPIYSNGYAGADQRVLVAQLTTDGEVSGQMYVQVFPNGVGANAEYLTLSFGTNSCGCLNEEACNYDASATYSNEAECVFPEDLHGVDYVDCDGACVNDADGDGICDEEEVAGCTDDTACNYDLNATDNDGSCFFTDDCSGCTDATACNYAPNASTDDGSCTFAEFGLDCDGNCLDQNSDLICDALQGCNDPVACNYDPSAEQPSQDFCDYCSCPILSSTDADYSIEVEEVAVNGIPGMNTYRVYITTQSPTDRLSAILGNDENPIVLASSSQFFQDVYGSEFKSPVALFSAFPTLEYDSWVTIGENTPVSSLQVPTQLGGSDPAWIADFESGSDIVINDVVGSGWYLSAETGDAYGVAGEDQRIMVAQLTTPGTLNIQLYAQIFPNGLAAGNTKYVSLSYGSPLCACTDETACNYDDAAITDDGNCYYITNEASCDDVCLFDNQAPVIEGVEDYTTSCSAIDNEYVFPVASDNCDSELDYAYVDVITPGACPNAYTITRTWTVTDNVGYMASVVQHITVEDNDAPTFTVPADASIACGADAQDLSLTGDVTDAADACGDVTVSFTDAFAATSNCFANDVILRTWTAVDACGNETSAVQTISIVDEVAPVFTSVPADMDIACGDDVPTDMAVAMDACSGVTVAVELSEGEVSCSGMAAVIRTFIATDGCGNTATATQVVTYVDTEAPTFMAPADASVECGADASPAAMGEPTDLADNCMSDLTVAHEDVIESSADGCFADDVIRRTWTVTDGCGNATSAVQIISLVDTTAPEMDAVAATIELGCGEAIPTALPAATDGCSAVTVTITDVDADMSCTGMMNIERTYTATDACGNATSQTQMIVFTDDVAPTFTAPADVTLECGTDLSDLALTGEVMDAADVCSADITLTYEDAVSTSEGSCFNDNVITRTWTATDGCGNASTDVQVITLVDTTAPVIIGETEVQLTYNTSETLPQLVGLEIIDCADYTVETEDTYAGFGAYTFDLSRVYTVTDACGNVATFSQHVVASYSPGCTYPDAVNYDETAFLDDGSCIYSGCTDMGAANYNPIASEDDGSCVIVGCMDPDGLDYNADANYPGGCDYPDPCPGDLDDNGEVNVNDLLEFFQYYGTSCN